MATIAQQNKIDSYKKPSNSSKRKYIGIELEFSSPTYRNIVDNLIIKHKLTKYLQLGYDGRTSPGDVDSYELKVLIHTGEIKTILPRVGTLLVDIKANINNSHGMHVHLDMRHRDVDKSYNNLTQSQVLLFSMADKYRRGNKFCVPQKTTNLDQADRCHYSAINPVLDPQKNTIEVRIKEGLVDIQAIQDWIVLLNEIVDAPLFPMEVKKLSDLEKVMKVNDQMKQYIKSTVKNFKGKSKLRGWM